MKKTSKSDRKRKESGVLKATKQESESKFKFSFWLLVFSKLALIDFRFLLIETEKI